MSKPELILIGAGGHALSCIDVIERQGKFQVAGIIGLSRQEGSHALTCGYSIIGFDEDLTSLAKNYQYALIAIGQIKSANQRIKLYQRIIELGFQLPTIVAPTAHVSYHATLGSGTIIMHGAVVNAGAVVGNNCIVNSLALIEHDVIVEDHCHISTGAILNGGVLVGTGSFIGSGSIVKQGISIGKGSMIGMGAPVLHNLPENTNFIGHHRHEK